MNCFIVPSKWAPTAYMIHLAADSAPPIASLSAVSIPPVFTADNDVLTQDWGPTDVKCPDFDGPLDVITSPPDGGEGDEDVTMHGYNISKAGHLLVPKDMSKRLMSQWHKTTTLHTGAQRHRESLQARFVISHLKDICKKVCAHCPVCQAGNPGNYRAPGESQFYPIPEHPFELVCLDVFSMPVKELGSRESTSCPFDAVLTCVDRQSGNIVAALTSEEGCMDQRAAELLYRNWFRMFESPA